MKGAAFILTSILLNVIGQLSFKHAMNQLGWIEFHLSKIPSIAVLLVKQPFVLLGLFSYLLSAFFWIVGLSRVELSYAYPFLSLGYLLVFFLSWWFFSENITWLRFIGTFIICIGLFLIAKSG
jgi:drug/metabolite transporter (DMT)-like permease